MKCIILVLLFIKQTFGCTIVDPTYDFSFKTLFGSNGQSLGNISPRDRLIALLTSILEPMFQIKVKSLEYENSESKSGYKKDLLFDIMVSCKCKKDGKDLPHLIDLEIQRVKTNDFVARTVLYGNRLTDQASMHSISYSKQPKSMVISIIDDILNDFPNDVAFYVGPCFKTVYSLPDGTPDGKLVYNSPLQVFIQLPLLCQEIKDAKNNDYTQNEWLKLLGSRRIYAGLDIKYTPSGNYEINEGDFKDNTVKNSVQVLKELNGNILNYNLNITNQNRAIEEENATKMELEQAKEQLKATNEQLEQLKLKTLLIRDIKKYRECTKPEGNSYKFAKHLEGKKEKLNALLNDKQKASLITKSYLENIMKRDAAFDDKSMEEDSFE